jgi:phosphatidylinositol alpha-1,6-mannosyltransferase
VTPDRLLLLAPSIGFGGGIERVAAAIERSWEGECRRVDLYRRGRVERAAGGRLTQAAFAVRALRAALGRRPDIVLTLHVGLLPVAMGLGAALRARTALMGIGHEVWGDLGAPTRRMIAGCSHLLSISDFTAKVLAERAGIDVERIRTVPLPVDRRILALAGEARHTMREPLILTVARLASTHRYKGHWAIAESLPALLAERPEARWHVIGDGDDVTPLRELCSRLGVAHAVRFEGLVPDERLAELYARASAFVLPSVTDVGARPPTGEGFGLVYAEAAAFGLPSIASTASGGAADFVRDGETGLTVPPGDSAALATAMDRLLGDGELRDRLGAAARAKVFESHREPIFGATLSRALASPGHRPARRSR